MADEIIDYDLFDLRGPTTARLHFAMKAPPPDLVARNVAKIEVAKAVVRGKTMSNVLRIPFDEKGEITGKQLKELLSEKGYDLENLAMRVINHDRIPYTLAHGTDRNGDKHHDHGSGDCALAMKEHGMVPCAFNYARMTFASPLKQCQDDRVLKASLYAVLIYKADCLYPLESSIGNLSSGFHLFLTAPQQALLATVEDAARTSKAYAAEAQERRAYGFGYKIRD